jgi:hypothetical protein
MMLPSGGHRITKKFIENAAETGRVDLSFSRQRNTKV